jgi:hypothetical protein
MIEPFDETSQIVDRPEIGEFLPLDLTGKISESIT